MALVKCKECSADISDEANTCPKCGAIQKRKTSLFTWFVTGVVALWMFGHFVPQLFGNKTDGVVSKTSWQLAMETAKLQTSWNKTGFNNVMEADFVVRNDSKYTIHDIEITCQHYAKSGTMIDSNKRVIYDTIPAESEKSFEKFNMGFINSQADSTSCSITNLKL